MNEQPVAPDEQRPLAQQHDVLLVDLDGTLVLAGRPIDHVTSSLARVREIGTRVLIVTNNASRAPASVAAELSGMGIPFAADDVVSSPLAAARMLAQTHGAGDRVLVVGTDALADAVTAAGLVPVRSAADAPVAVVQGHSPDTCWRDLAEACIALRAGVDWVATNTDSTLPTDRGLLPGNGSMVQALVTATERQPRVAGKPGRPLLDTAVERAGARRPLVVGDRLDTDIAAAVAAGMPSLLVLSGVSSAADLLTAPERMRPTSVALDLRGLLDPAACAALDGDPSPVGSGHGTAWRVVAQGDRLELHGQTAASPVSALSALARQAWRTGVTEVRAGDAAARAALAALGWS